MSASQKKQLRKEQNAAKMTEKQQQSAKEAQKLHFATIAFTVVIVLMLCVVIVVSINSSGIIPRNTTALTVDETEVSAVEMNYYYMDCINSFLESNGDYLSFFGIDSEAALDEQTYDEETGETWADYFINYAAESAKGSYALYNAAIAEGYTLSEEDAAAIDNSISYIRMYASMYGYSNVNSYLAAYYGPGSNEDTYRDYCEVQYIASAYANDYHDSLSYTDEDISAALAENPNAYTSYTYNYYYLAASRFNQGGTEGEDGKVTYSDAEVEAGRVACGDAAAALAAGSYASIEEFNAAIQALSINAESTASSTACTDYLYSSVTTLMQDWVTDEARVAGDVTYLPYTTTATDDDGNETETLNGYYVIYYVSSNDNLQPLANVRHILVPFEGGTTDDEGNTTYSDEEKNAAHTEAMKLHGEWLNGEATEDSFAALANEKSTDAGSNTNGGLYEDVYPGQMVTNFNDWCFDESRQSGDTGIVESSFGYHIMYYVGDSETTYRDYMIVNALRESDYSDWETAAVEDITVTVVNSKYVNTSITLG